MHGRVIPSLLTLGLCAATTALADTELFTCSESGSGSTYFRVCVADSGNVTLFKSPWGMEHIRVISGPGNNWYADAGALEGFNVCHSDPFGWGEWWRSFDFGGYLPDRATSSWGGVNFTYKIEQPKGPGKFPLRIYQRMGPFELKQEFTVDQAEREITIAMTLYNRSGELLRDVKLIRGANLNIDNTSEYEGALLGKRSMVQYDSGPPEGGNRNAVSLTALIQNYPVEFSSIDTMDLWDTSDMCDGSFRAYYSGAMVQGISYKFGNLAEGASRTVKFAYRAF